MKLQLPKVRIPYLLIYIFRWVWFSWANSVKKSKHRFSTLKTTAVIAARYNFRIKPSLLYLGTLPSSPNIIWCMCIVSRRHWFFPLLLHGVFEVLSTPLDNNQFEPSFSPSTSSTLHKYHNCQCCCLFWGLEVSSSSFGGGVLRGGHWYFYTASSCLKEISTRIVLGSQHTAPTFRKWSTTHTHSFRAILRK